MEENRKELVECMNMFCEETFSISSGTEKEMDAYIERNIGEFRNAAEAASVEQYL